MKLIRLRDGKLGLVVLLPAGPHLVDIASSLGVFAPHDALSIGLLNGALKDGCNWSLLVKHWALLRSPLKKLAWIALTSPDHPHLVLQPPQTTSKKGMLPTRSPRSISQTLNPSKSTIRQASAPLSGTSCRLPTIDS
jgi:hypothetical protein